MKYKFLTVMSCCLFLSSCELIGLEEESFEHFFVPEDDHSLQILQDQGISYFKIKDRNYFIISSDMCFIKGYDARLTRYCELNLQIIAKFIKNKPHHVVQVSGFTDDIAHINKHHAIIVTQKQADTVLGYLWSHKITPEKLYSQGYGPAYNPSSNTTIHGSAMNRRIEISWSSAPGADLEYSKEITFSK
jgi:outer membrane protein OmpA-like peptidoglycan-associated protein